jgi:hypothetical protein
MHRIVGADIKKFIGLNIDVKANKRAFFGSNIILRRIKL